MNATEQKVFTHVEPIAKDNDLKLVEVNWLKLTTLKKDRIFSCVFSWIKKAVFHSMTVQRSQKLSARSLTNGILLGALIT